MTKANNQNRRNKKLKIYILVSLFSALIAVLSFITIPSPVPFTLQLSGVFTALTVLGGKRGLVSIILYIILGALGLPVFSSFSGGLGHLFGATGGYVLGFIPLALVYIVFERFSRDSAKTKAAGLLSGLVLCYVTGTLWYCVVCFGDLSAESVKIALTVCVLPFVLPDLIKLYFGILLGRKLKPFIF